MTRGTEALLRNLILAASALLVLAGAGLGVWAFTEREDGAGPEDANPIGDAKPPSAVIQDNPQLDQLARAKMTRTVAPKASSTAKPPTPALDTLIRVKGIMDFGDSKSNEAIIEDVKSGRSQNYHVGEQVRGTEAVITQIDSGVTFKYDGKSVRLEMRGNERSESKPMASPGSDVRLSENGGTQVNP
jgi:hypothetical protein